MLATLFQSRHFFFSKIPTLLVYVSKLNLFQGLPLVHTHLGVVGVGVNSPIHFHCVLHAKTGGGGRGSRYHVKLRTFK